MKLAVIGAVGVPSCYGGFETMAENLVVHAHNSRPDAQLTVWCSAVGMRVCPPRFRHADLRYIPLKANGVQSVLYDFVSLLDAIRTRHDRILVLGVSGALLLSLIRLISRARVATNIDGIEWRRSKWSGPARVFLRASEWAAVRFSHTVIADNKAIADYVRNRYGLGCAVIC